MIVGIQGKKRKEKKRKEKKERKKERKKEDLVRDPNFQDGVHRQGACKVESFR